MKRINRYLCLLSIFLLFCSSTALAENVEWKNKGVDFESAQTVYIEPNIEYYQGTILFDVDKANIANAIKRKSEVFKRI